VAVRIISTEGNTLEKNQLASLLRLAERDGQVLFVRFESIAEARRALAAIESRKEFGHLEVLGIGEARTSPQQLKLIPWTPQRRARFMATIARKKGAACG
jgi:hypothetical protein